MTRTVIVDFGLGNIRSLVKATEHLGVPAEVTSDPVTIASADKLLLPGDGAFGAAMRNLTEPVAGGRSLADLVLDAVRDRKPLLGICVGMQVLLDRSEEFGEHVGLGEIAGDVRRFPESPGVKVPQIGWNELEIVRPDSRLLAGVRTGERVYFIHSYYCAPEDEAAVAARTDHGIRYASVLERGALFSTQFHPEKSGDVGLRILENFLRL